MRKRLKKKLLKCHKCKGELGYKHQRINGKNKYDCVKCFLEYLELTF